MPIPPTDLERKVHQLDNDVQAIYELLSGIEGTLKRHGNRLMEISAELGTRFGEVDTRLDGIDTRLDGIDTRLDGMDQRFDGMDQRFDGMDHKLDRVLELLSGPAE
jgi:hypothetical protein